MLKWLISSLGCLVLLFLLSTSCKSSRNLQGEWLYNKFCANCHMENGEGLRGLIPPLAGADYLEANRNLIPCIIRYGQQEEIVVNGQTYQQAMNGVPELNEVEITNIINYVNQAWGNDLPYFPLDSVKASLEGCE